MQHGVAETAVRWPSFATLRRRNGLWSAVLWSLALPEGPAGGHFLLVGVGHPARAGHLVQRCLGKSPDLKPRLPLK